MVSNCEPSVKDAFVALVQKQRVRKGWDSARLAREAGISKGTLWQVEHGKTTPNLQTASRILRALGVGNAAAGRLLLEGVAS